jgi:hypothetical protein
VPDGIHTSFLCFTVSGERGAWVASPHIPPSNTVTCHEALVYGAGSLSRRWRSMSAWRSGFGALLLVVAVSDLSARLVVLVLGLGLLVVTALFIRGAFGVVSGLLIGLTLILISRQQPEIISKGVLWVMAVTMIVDSFVHLIFIPTDSQLLQKRTGINFGYWIVLWWVIAGLILVWALNRAYGVPLPWTLLGRGV